MEQTLKEQIEKLEEQLRQFKKSYEEQETLNYRNQTHKHFEEGDIVTNGNYVVKVEWLDNKAVGMPYEHGYMGATILNNSLGFGTFRRDEFELVKDNYYTKEHEIKLYLTGTEIERIKHYLHSRNMNPSKAKDKLWDVFDGIENKTLKEF